MFSGDWIEDCIRWHSKVLTGKRAHWCRDFDDLPIDDTMSEALDCTCYHGGLDERTPEEIMAIVYETSLVVVGKSLALH